ncbi:MAG: CdaR family protein [Bryobacteraceae bacterium]
MKRWLLENLGWKLFSLALAGLLWLTFVSSPDLVTWVTAPIEYANVPPEMELVPESAERIRLEVRGPSSRIHQFEGSAPAVVVDLSGIQAPCERTFNITAEQVKLPPGLTLVRAIPAQVRLRLEKRVRRAVPVRPRITRVPPGFRIESQAVQPAELTVVGPESRAELVEFVETDPVECAATTAEQVFRVHSFVRDPELRLEFNGPVTVRLRLARTEEAPPAEGAPRG